MILDGIAVIGPGRVGLSLARALIRAGAQVAVLGRHPRTLPDQLGDIATVWGPRVAEASLILIAVPDDAIEAVALVLATTGAVTDEHIVLHTSGIRDRSALAALDATGAALGSWHPLQTFSSPAGDPDALAGSPAVLEGDPRALEAGRDLAARLGMHPVIEIPAAGKAAYHAAAVVASNYLVVLADISARLARGAGAGDDSQALFAPLMQRTAANFVLHGSGALTGPIRRGDLGTVARHLQLLHGAEREIYVVLGQAALRLARVSGLDEATALEMERLLTTGR